ncbi:MAG: hypothetical protein AAF196_20985 [Planctomycetota bacterium]
MSEPLAGVMRVLSKAVRVGEVSELTAGVAARIHSLVPEMRGDYFGATESGEFWVEDIEGDLHRLVRVKKDGLLRYSTFVDGKRIGRARLWTEESGWSDPAKS